MRESNESLGSSPCTVSVVMLFQAAGKYRQQGRQYTVDDGDIIFFKFNAGAGLKDAGKKKA